MRRRRSTGVLAAVGLILAVLVLHASPAASAGGTLDTTFGTTGVAAIDFGNGSFDTVYDLAVLGDGKLVVAGKTDVGFGVARLTAAGVLDPAFGTGGVVAGAFMSEARGVAVQGDGKLVVAGRTAATAGSLVLARYTTAGALDSTFGTAGKVTVAMTGAGSGGSDVAVQSDGKLVVLAADAGALHVLRYTAVGVLDATFDTDGRAATSLVPTGDDRLALQSDQKILLSGTGGVARLTAAGVLDTFGTAGVASTANHVPRALAVQSDGKSIVGGDFGTADTKALVARRDAAGALDTGFGTGGVASFAVTGLATASVRAVAVQADGKIVVAGRLGDTTRASLLFVARLTAAGVLDATFGTAGIATVATAGGLGTSSVSALGLVGTTGYLLAGSVIDTARSFANDNDFAVLRVATGDGPAGGSSSTTVPGAVVAGGRISSEPDGTQPTAANKLIAEVTTPNAGTVSFTKVASPSLAGYRALAAITITAPAASAAQPLQLRFRVDVSTLPASLPLGAISVVRDTSPARECTSTTAATPDPCVLRRARTGNVLELTVLTSTASTWTLARPFVQRVFGDDRTASAVAVSRTTYADKAAGAVVLSRSDAFADALAATPLAVAKKGPLLLTSPGALDDRVLTEITRVLPGGKPVYLLGGERALSAAIEDRLLAWGYEVIRYSGADRYETAYLVAVEGLQAPKGVILTTGLAFADALTAGVVASATGRAVLLTRGASLPEPTRAYLAQFRPERLAMGGPAAAADPESPALVGNTRYETAALAAKYFFPKATMVAMASGNAFADALAGGVHAATIGAPLLLGPTAGDLPAGVSIYFRELPAAPSIAFLYGGTTAIGADVATGLQSALGG